MRAAGQNLKRLLKNGDGDDGLAPQRPFLLSFWLVINTITSPELWAYASRVKTGNDMHQRLNQGQASLHGLCTFLFVSEGQVVNARLEGVAA